MRSKIRHGGFHAARSIRWAAGLMLLAGMLSACTSPSDDGNVEVSIVDGSISGVITDSRGTPIEGAVVSYDEPGTSGGTTTLTVSTAADGSFSFDSVGVTAATGPEGNDLNGPLTLQISPGSAVPTLDATVSISPTAQLNNASVFSEDFVVSTGTIPVPALDKLVQGTLRDVNSGAALADQTVNLTWKGVEFTPDLATGIKVSYSLSDNQSLVTATSGAISFDSAPNDSCLELLVSSLAISSISGSSASCGANTVETRDPDALYLATATTPSSVQLGSVFVSGYTDADTIAPYVTSVTGVLDASASPAPLSSSINGVSPNGIKLQFSEPLASGISTNDVVVSYGSGSQTVAGIASVSLTNNSLVTINLTSPLPAGTTVYVQLAREAFSDLAGNPAGLSRDIGYDSLTGSSSQTLTLTLGTASSFDTVPPYVTGVEGVTDSNSNPAELSSSITGVSPNELVVRFSEALSGSINTSDVEVLVGSGATAYVATISSVSLSDSDSALHIALRDSLPISTSVTINLAREALSDTADNGVALNGAIAYDAFTGSTSDQLTLYLVTAVGDLDAPYVSSVENVVSSPNVNPAILDSSIDGVAPNEFVLVFNEPLSAVTASSVSVSYGRLNRPATIASVSLQNNSTELHISLRQPIAADTSVTVELTRSGVVDLAGNTVGLNDAIAYDAVTGSSEDILSIYLITSAD